MLKNYALDHIMKVRKETHFFSCKHPTKYWIGLTQVLSISNYSQMQIFIIEVFGRNNLIIVNLKVSRLSASFLFESIVFIKWFR